MPRKKKFLIIIIDNLARDRHGTTDRNIGTKYFNFIISSHILRVHNETVSNATEVVYLVL